MVRTIFQHRFTAALVCGLCLLTVEVASAQYHLPGFSPRVRGRRPVQGQRNDPAPQMGQQRMGPQGPQGNQLPPTYAQRPPLQAAPQRPALRPVPATQAPPSEYAGPPQGGPVQPVAHQTIDRTAMKESQVFYDDAPAGGEELPPPTYDGGAPYSQGPPVGGDYFDPQYGGAPYQYDGPAAPNCGYGDCVEGPWGAHLHGDFHVGPFYDAFQNLSLFAGVQGFKSPVDLGINGNFGFHEGLNYGGCVTSIADIGYQIGAQALQSDLSGYTTGGGYSDDARHQYFVTGGIFRRYRQQVGFQWGVVYDYLHDDYDIDMDVGQVRGEIAFRGWHCNEIGFMFAANASDDEQPILDSTGQTTLFLEEWTTTDQFAIFWRRQFCNGATVKLWGGGTGDSDGLLGGEFEIPISCSWAVSGIANYKIPEDGATFEGSRDEAWGIGMSLIWYPCGTANQSCGCGNRFRPLFNVADNATMLLDRSTVSQLPID